VFIHSRSGLRGFLSSSLNLNGPVAAAVGALVGAGVVVFEFRIRQVSLKRLIGAAFGSVLGFWAPI